MPAYGLLFGRIHLLASFTATANQLRITISKRNIRMAAKLRQLARRALSFGGLINFQIVLSETSSC
jgi:hypothetical protein